MEGITLKQIERRKTMNNYINDATFVGKSAKSESSYSMHEENKQYQLISQIAKQAAKLMSSQIKDSNDCFIESKRIPK